MKTPEEIKKGMQHCLYNEFANYGCKGCPYQLPGGFSRMHECQYDVVKDVYSLIQQLEADNSRKDDTIRSLTEQLNASHEETAKAMRERDAAVYDVSHLDACDACIHGFRAKNDCSEINKGNACTFEWRGVCPENTEVQEDAAE